MYINTIPKVKIVLIIWNLIYDLKWKKNLKIIKRIDIFFYKIFTCGDSLLLPLLVITDLKKISSIRPVLLSFYNFSTKMLYLSPNDILWYFAITPDKELNLSKRQNFNRFILTQNLYFYLKKWVTLTIWCKVYRKQKRLYQLKTRCLKIIQIGNNLKTNFF